MHSRSSTQYFSIGQDRSHLLDQESLIDVQTELAHIARSVNRLNISSQMSEKRRQRDAQFQLRLDSLESHWRQQLDSTISYHEVKVSFIKKAIARDLATDCATRLQTAELENKTLQARDLELSSMLEKLQVVTHLSLIP